MESTILTNVSVSELTEIISDAIKSQLSQIEQPEPEPEFITRKETAELLGISLPTLWTWTRNGKVPAYKIGSRVRFKKSEVLNSLNKIEA